jgi:hypothetical protein
MPSREVATAGSTFGGCYHLVAPGAGAGPVITPPGAEMYQQR